MAERDTSRIRLAMVGIVCVALFAALLTRLWFLQVIDQSEFQVRASRVHLRVVREEGPRGRILDRKGRVIVDNRVSLVLGLDRQGMRGLSDRRRQQLFDRLSATLTSFGLPTKSALIQSRYADKRWGPLELVPLVTDLPNQDLELYLAENADEFPGVVVKRRTVRTYPYGTLAAHLVGYVGRIAPEELERKQAEQGKPDPGRPLGTGAKPYAADDEIGKAGIEATYEDDLRGVPADRRIQVDARGDYLTTVKEAAAQPGNDVWLTIDLDLQALAERLLQQTLGGIRGRVDRNGKVLRAPQGSIVVMNPGTGEVLAMASYPSYDPSQLVNGIDSELWKQLNDKAAGQPLFNWALQGTYAPGSTFKLITAAAALEKGFLRPGNDTYLDSGSYRIGGCRSGKCVFRNAGGVRHGRVDVTQSLTVSSDVYYYWIADQLWKQRATFGETAIQDTAKAFGLGAKSGIALPGEAKGRIPTPASMAAQNQRNPEAFPRGTWTAGDNLNTAIGQGDVLVTPLQLVHAYATFANGGRLLRPLVMYQVSRPKDAGLDPADPSNFSIVRRGVPDEYGRVNFSGDNYAKIASGLLGVVMSPNGTARGAWSRTPTAWPMAGKTGTAQVQGRSDTSIFVAYGPAGSPEPPSYAISVIIPEAGFGGDVAAPLAFGVMQPVSRGAVPPVGGAP